MGNLKRGDTVIVNNNETEHVEFIGKQGVIKDVLIREELETLYQVSFKEMLSMKGFRSEEMEIGLLYFVEEQLDLKKDKK